MCECSVYVMEYVVWYVGSMCVSVYGIEVDLIFMCWELKGICLCVCVCGCVCGG